MDFLQGKKRADYSTANLDARQRTTLVSTLTSTAGKGSIMGANEQFILFTQPG